jgi:hypothetical protein
VSIVCRSLTKEKFEKVMFEGFREYASIQCATGQYSTVSKACCWNPVIRQIEENSEKILKKDIHTVKCPVCRLHVFEFHLLTVPLIFNSITGGGKLFFAFVVYFIRS